MLARTSSGSEMSQNGCAQIGDAAGVVDRVDGLRDGGRLAQAERGLALDQVAADQRADVVDVLLAQALGVGGGARARRPARWGRPIGLPAAMRASISASSSSKPTLAQGVAHAQRALLAVGQEVARAER